MNKTGLGIAVGFLGAVCYLVADYSIWAGVGIMLVVLLVETDEMAKTHAVQAVLVSLLFLVLNMGWGIIDSFLGMLPDISGYLADNIVYGLLSIGHTIITFLLVILALTGSKVKLPFVASIFNKADGIEQ